MFEGNQKITVRDRSYARLKLLYGDVVNDTMTVDELNAVTAHLMNNVPQFEPALRDPVTKLRISREELHSVLTRSILICINRVSTDEMISTRHPDKTDILYRHGTPSDKCILILSGKIVVYSGKDEFRSELGPWSIIGIDALGSEPYSFTPDYTAFILSSEVRYLVITRQSFFSNNDPRRLVSVERVRSLSCAVIDVEENILGSNPAIDFQSHRNVVSNTFYLIYISKFYLTQQCLVQNTVRNEETKIDIMPESRINARQDEVTVSPMWPNYHAVQTDFEIESS